MRGKLIFKDEEVEVKIPKHIELLSQSCNVIAQLMSDDMVYEPMNEDDLEFDDYIDGLLDYADDTIYECYNFISAYYLKVGKKHFDFGKMNVKFRFKYVDATMVCQFLDENETEEFESKEFMNSVKGLLNGK